MVLQKGNTAWKNRKKFGRNKKFATPDALWEAAMEYFEYCDTNPWMKNEVVKSGPKAGKILQVPTQTPYSLKGLMLFIGVGPKWWYDFKKNENNKNFLEVMEKIEMTIETQQFEGAVVGAFNPAIISRKLGLDKPEQTFINVNPGKTEVVFKRYRNED